MQKLKSPHVSMIENNPSFTIIVPVYNGGSTLRKCLESIFDSSEYDSEVIVVNDGSTDNTVDVAKLFPCRIINLSKNQGAASARNIGAKEAKGEVLLFIDADIILENNTINKFIEEFRQKTMQILVGIYGNKVICSNVVSVYKNLHLHFEHMHTSRRFWSGCAAINKQSFFQIGMFDKEKKGSLNSEDTKFGYDAISKGCRVLVNTDIRVSHNHYYSLKGLVRNEFYKTLGWLRILFAIKNKRVAQGHYLNLRNIFSLLCIYLSLTSSFLTFFSTQFALLSISLMILFVLLNLSFYILIMNEKGFRYLVPAPFLHMLSFLVVGIGIIVGLISCRR